MANVDDVAAYILEQHGPMTAWKLQKLVYYAQAWNLVWEDTPLFREPILAWANGPVCPALYAHHRGKFEVSPPWRDGNSVDVADDERESIDVILQSYGDKSAQWLSDLTHAEPPWQEARVGLANSERGNREITHNAMAEYYGTLASAD